MKDQRTKKEIITTIVLLVLVLIVWQVSSAVRTREQADLAKQPPLPEQKAIEAPKATPKPIMTLQSADFEQSGKIPVVHTCDGTDQMPALSWSDVPADARSLALIMEDPDVPKTIKPDGMWNHMVVFDIPTETKEVATGGKIAGGTYGMNSSQKNAYQGPCPPNAEHRYFFRLYALDTKLGLPESTNKDELLAAMSGHILAQAELIGRYGPKQKN